MRAPAGWRLPGVRAARLRVLVAWLASSGCSGETPSPEVMLADSAGIEIAAPAELPPLLSGRHLWRLSVLRSFELERGRGEPPLLYDPSAALPLSDGSLLVADAGGDRVLHVLDLERGVVTRSFGRRGEGPGELGGYPVLHQAGDGTIRVADPSNRKLLAFSPDGVLLEERPVRGTASGWRFEASGALLAERFVRLRPSDFSMELIRVDPRTGAEEPFAPLPDPPAGTAPGRIQPGRPLWVPLEAGVVTAMSADPVFRVHDGLEPPAGGQR